MRVATFIIIGGIAAVTSLGFVCVKREAPAIVRNLQAGASAAIASGDSEWAILGVDGREITLSGTPPTIADRDRVLRLVRAAPGVRSVADATERAEVPVLTRDRDSRGQAEACQRELDALLADEVIHFEVLSAAISPSSRPLLDELARALMQCPDVRIEIAGHTDGEGIAELNLRLSEARAESVRNFLIHKGIDGARMVAVGHGSARPIADDLLEDGRMKNRRIEFKVQGIDT